MTIKAPVRRKWGRSRPKPEPIPVFPATGPRALRFDVDERVAYLYILTFLVALGLFGVGAAMLGPATAKGAGYVLPGISLSFIAYGWLVAWRPMVSSRALIRHGHYTNARIVRFECPWWSELLKVVRPFLVMASRAALTAEVGYRLTLEVPDGAGGTRRIQRLVWRAFATTLPKHGQVVGVFHDPHRSDRFVFASDLKRLGIKAVGTQKD
ncbi:MAG: hypothetical protein GY946_23340 [bacterium]|nr:hypothetical protein [bacterium]